MTSLLRGLGVKHHALTVCPSIQADLEMAMLVCATVENPSAMYK